MTNYKMYAITLSIETDLHIHTIQLNCKFFLHFRRQASYTVTKMSKMKLDPIKSIIENSKKLI